MKTFYSLLLGLGAIASGSAAERLAGGDISLLPEYSEAGAVYKTQSGEPIADLLSFFKEAGMGAMRVRLFVNPEDYKGADADPNACQSLEYIIPICRQIKEAGLSLLLDFHYSDTWADPAKQYTPAAWADLTDDELYATIHDYTRETLLTLRAEGIVPEYIQTGNEISYGMLWGPEGTSASQQKKCFINSTANWERFGTLLSNAISACREVCPDAAIILHTERVAEPTVLTNFYTQMQQMNVDYDIIGLSYYPYFHGKIGVLDKALHTLAADFPGKEIMVVETGYPYKWEVPGTTEAVDYPYSDSGQNQFAADLVQTVQNYDNVTGLFWWWPEYNAYNTNLSGWYNAPLFDSTTGCATSALNTFCSFASDNNSISGITADDEGQTEWYDLAGRKISLPAERGLYISSGKKILIGD